MHGRRRGARRTRLEVVMRELGRMRVRLRLAHLEPLGEFEVEPHARRLTESCVEHLAHHVVCEAMGVRGAGIGYEQPGRDRLVEGGRGAGDRSVAARQLRDAIDAEARTDHGRRREQAAAAIRHAIESALDGLPDARRRRRGFEAAGVERRAAAAGEPHQLAHVERIAVRAAQQRRDRVVRERLFRDCGTDPADCLRVEPRERNDRGVRRERVDRSGLRRIGCELAAADRRDHEQRLPREPVGELREQRERARVGPLQVVEQHEERALGGGSEQEPRHCVAEPEARCLGVERRPVGRGLAEFGQELGDESRVRTQQHAQRGQVACVEPAAQYLHPEPESRRAGRLVTAAEEQFEAVRARRGGGRLGEGGLADPGLARHEHERAAAVARPGEALGERGERGVASEESGCGGRRRCRA